MRKILHFTDFHCGAANSRYTQRLWKIVNLLTSNRSPVKPHEVILAVTGDLVDLAEDAYYHEASAAISEFVQAGYPVVVIPGNHDLTLHGDSHVRPELLAKFWDWLVTKIPNHPSVKWVGGKPASPQFPFCLTVDDEIAVYGLNSMAKAPINRHRLKITKGLGQIGGTQMIQLARLLGLPATQHMHKVVLLHHDPIKRRTHMYLEDRRQFLSLFKNRPVDAILCGHMHNATRYRRRVPQWLNGALVLEGGTTTKKQGLVGILTPGNSTWRMLDVENRKIVAIGKRLYQWERQSNRRKSKKRFMARFKAKAHPQK